MNRGNPYGFGLIVVGAVMVAVSTFMPLAEPTGMFRFVQQNTLIQHGGWVFLAGAVGLAGAGFRGFLNRKDWYNPLIISIIGAVGVLIWTANKSLRTLYPIGLDGAADSTEQGQVADWGISIYVAGFGVLLGIIGSFTLRQVADSAAKRKCPDCAETVLADAQVCKHCGYRFPAVKQRDGTDYLAAGAAARAAQVKSAKKRKLKCKNCETTMSVEPDCTEVTCPGCKKVLHVPPRKTAQQN